jgi:hypothetical protein
MARHIHDLKLPLYAFMGRFLPGQAALGRPFHEMPVILYKKLLNVCTRERERERERAKTVPSSLFFP